MFLQCYLGGGNRNHQYSCVCLHGDRKPPERKANLETFKREEAKFLICTDVAARGLDISGLPFSKYFFYNKLKKIILTHIQNKFNEGFKAKV